VRFWQDERVKQLDRLDRLLFLYLITCPESHFSGVYRCDRQTVGEAVCASPRTVLRRLRAFTDMQLTQFDAGRSIVWVCRMLAYQGVGGPLVAANVRRHLSTFPSCEIISSFNIAYPWIAAATDRVSDTPSDRVSPKGIRYVVSSEQLAVTSSYKELGKSDYKDFVKPVDNSQHPSSNSQPNPVPSPEQTRAYLDRLHRSSQ